MNKVYMPWPIAMKIADDLDKQGMHQLAREARRAVWDEALRLWEKEELGIEWVNDQGNEQLVIVIPGEQEHAVEDHQESGQVSGGKERRGEGSGNPPESSSGN